MKTFLFSFILIVGIPFSAFAQFLPYAADQFGKAEGLIGTPTCMSQDDNGFLWLGTSDGLFRFDGVHATKINYLPSDTLPKKALNIYDLSFDPQTQRLWIATEWGIFRYDLRSGQTMHLQAKDFFGEKAFGKNAARAIFTDRQGETWADFVVYGLVHLQDGGEKAECYFLPLSDREKAAGLDGNMANKVAMIAQDANLEHIIWATTRRGLLRFDKDKKELRRFVFYPREEGMLLDANSMPCLFPHKNGSVYIGSWDAGLLKFDPRTESFSPFFPHKNGWTAAGNTNRVSKLIPADGGNLWADCSEGSRLFDVEKERFTTDDQPGFSIDFRDRNGHLWQFKEGLNLYHRYKNKFEKRPFPDFLVCEPTSELPFDTIARQVFLRSKCQKGLWAMNVDDFSWKQYPLPNRPAETVTLSGYSQGPDGFYISDELNRIYFRANGKDEFRRVPAGPLSDFGSLNIAVRADGQVFVTGHEGWLFWFGSGSWQPFVFNKANAGEPYPDFFSCTSQPCFDRQGRLWIRACDGFSIFSPVEKDSFGEENRFAHFSTKLTKSAGLEAFRRFKLDGQNRMWTSGIGGFGWFDPAKPEKGLQKRYGPAEGFPFPMAVLTFFEKNKVWLLTQEGLVEFDPATEKYRLFKNIPVGSGNVISLGNGRALSFRGDGFYLFNLDSLQEISETPRPYISRFKVFEQPKHLTGSLFSPQKINLRPDENFFSIGFSALAWYDPRQIKFAYQLEGVNRDWVYPEPGVLATSFTNIKGGDYIFKIKTTDHRGEWLDNVYKLNIHVGTPWWQTAWFRLAVLAAIVAIVYFLVKNRFHQQKMQLENQRLLLEKEQSLRMERDRIAAEMHDELGAGLSTIRFLSLAAKEKETDPANAARIEKIANHAAQVMEKMADIIWVMNSRNDSLENFAAYLRRYAGELLETHDIRLVFEMPPDLPKKQLTGEQRRSLLLAVKECLHNVVKHAGATETRLSLQANGTLEITVQDNGLGIPAECLEDLNNGSNSLTSNGLRNIRQRMEALGGEAVFEIGEGTKVLLRTRISAG